MTPRVFAATVLGAAAWLALAPADSFAFGKRRSGCDGGACGGCAPAPAACDSCMGAGYYAAPAMAGGCCTVAAPTPAPAPTYVTQQVIRYRPETRSRQVQ